jgi:4-diphosphocytidyl-2-C-methyl-D-erythritol kinase
MENKQQFETLKEGLLVRAPAKINLTLLVAGKRPDGYHDLETIMAKIDWYDEILIEPGKKGGIEFICGGPQWAPAGQDNLVYRAAKSLLEFCSTQANLKITLTKNIPAGTGLGSGSSDAAATLMGLDRFLGLRTDQEHLMHLAATLGSDVPFFLNGPLALCTGKGEKIQKLDEKFDFRAVLVLPDINVSTTKVYANYRHDSSIYEKLHGRITGYIGKNRIDLATKMCANMLVQSSFGLTKELAELKTKIESLGVRPVCLTGSGSAMFYIAGDEEEAQSCKTRIIEKVGCKSVIVSNNKW